MTSPTTPTRKKTRRDRAQSALTAAWAKLRAKMNSDKLLAAAVAGSLAAVAAAGYVAYDQTNGRIDAESAQVEELQAEVVSLNDKIDQTVSDLEETNARIAAVAADLIDIADQIDALGGEIDTRALQVDFESMYGFVVDLAAQVESIDPELAQQALDVANQALALAQSSPTSTQVRDLGNQISQVSSDTTAAIAKQQSEIDTLNQQAIAAKVAADAAKTELASLQTQLDTLSADADTTEDALAAAEQAVAVAQAAADAAQADADTAQAAADAAQAAAVQASTLAVYARSYPFTNLTPNFVSWRRVNDMPIGDAFLVNNSSAAPQNYIIEVTYAHLSTTSNAQFYDWVTVKAAGATAPVWFDNGRDNPIPNVQTQRSFTKVLSLPPGVSEFQFNGSCVAPDQTYQCVMSVTVKATPSR